MKARMGDTQHFCLRWNNYQTSITSAFENLRDDEDFVDVTLACDGKSLKAHRVVLSACSPYFRELLKSTPCKHPVIVLQDVAFSDLLSLVEFIYHGEVNVHQRNLTSFLKTAEVLRVSGLTQQSDDKDETPTAALRTKPSFADNKHTTDPSFVPAPSPPPVPPTVPTGGGAGGGATVNQLLRRAAAMAANRRERRNSGAEHSDGSDHSGHSNGKRAKTDSTNNNEANGAAQDFSATTKHNANRKDESNHHRSPSPLSHDVKTEPLDLLMSTDLDNSGDSNDGARSDGDEGGGTGGGGAFFGGPRGAESKLFGTSGGSFDFSMAALAGDSTISGLNQLQNNPDGTPGGSQAGSVIHYRMPPPTSGGINEPQECPYCRRTFSCYYSLKRHFQDKHERSDTLYVCEFCQRRYRTKNSLTTHKSLQHRGSSGMLKRLLKNSAIHNVLGQPPNPPGLN